MEQEAGKSGYELQEEEKAGTVKIADDVVAMIAALAATEVDGVAAMSGNLTNELLSNCVLCASPSARDKRQSRIRASA